MKILRLWFLLVLVMAAQANASETAVYQQSVQKPIAEVYSAVYESLETAKFFVVFEANIGKNLAGFAQRWGEDYNKNELSAIRSIVFCNAGYANQVSNLDPAMLGFCPLHITLFEKAGHTTVLFNRPSAAIATSPALPVLREVEAGVIAAIERAVLL